jgi:hypothetical protein
MLTAASEALLTVCAQLLVSGEAIPRDTIDLSSVKTDLLRDRQTMKDPVHYEWVHDYLAQEVERLSDGLWTVRPIDQILLRHPSMGMSTCMVLCNPSTAADMVNDLTDDMEPFELVLSTTGLRTHQERNPPERVERIRQDTARREVVGKLKEEAASDLAAFERALKDAVTARMHACTDPVRREQFEQYVGWELMSMKSVSVACRILGITLQQLVAEVLAAQE